MLSLSVIALLRRAMNTLANLNHLRSLSISILLLFSFEKSKILNYNRTLLSKRRRLEAKCMLPLFQFSSLMSFFVPRHSYFELSLPFIVFILTE